MISGKVTPSREALLPLSLAGAGEDAVQLEALIDTGFTDYLTISREVVQRLNLAFRESMVYELANGEMASFDLHVARVQWDGQWREILVSVAEGGPLVGMALMQDYRLSIEVKDGGRVELQALNS